MITKLRRAFLALAMAAIPLATTATCDPYYGLSIYRDDDYDYVDIIVDDYYYDDCFFLDCF